MQLSDNPEKIALVERLVKDGAISLADAVMLLEKEVVKECVPIKEAEPKRYHPFPWPDPNAAKWWEHQALYSGNHEVNAVYVGSPIGSDPNARSMRPMHTEIDCVVTMIQQPPNTVAVVGKSGNLEYLPLINETSPTGVAYNIN